MRYYSDLKKLKLAPKKKQLHTMYIFFLLTICIALYANLVY